MDDWDYSERLASIARIVEVLGDELAADQRDRRCRGLECGGAPSQVLINELARLVVRLQRDLDDGRSDLVGERARRFLGERSAAGYPAVAGTLSSTRETVSDVADVAHVATPMSGVRGRGGDHGVHFSRSHEHSVAAVVDMASEAIDAGRAVVLVATGLHRRWIESELHQRGAQLDRDGFHVLDAATTLSSLLVDGRPDHVRFRSVIGALVTDVSSRAPAGVSVYGEMVGLLWEQGDAASAMRLEGFWNELQRDVPFSLMCGYLLDRRTDFSDLDPIRRLHSHTI